jgi:hypothetical protein
MLLCCVLMPAGLCRYQLCVRCCPHHLCLLRAGFDAEVRKANQSDIGKRNGGAMLSMQVRLLGVGVVGRGLNY